MWWSREVEVPFRGETRFFCAGFYDVANGVIAEGREYWVEEGSIRGAAGLAARVVGAAPER